MSVKDSDRGTNLNPEPNNERPFGRLLRFWRGVHGVRQEELAHNLESSPRHISRLENGRVYPSKAMVERIASELSLGERDTNHLLFSAGYLPVAAKVDFHTPELKWLRNAMTLTLRAMDPYPALLFDGSSNILMVNRGWVGFYQQILPLDILNEVTNHYEFLFSLPGFGSAACGWEDTLSVILMSLQQGVLLMGDAANQEMLDRLLASPNVPEDWKQRAARLEPMASFRVPIEINGELKLFYSVSQTVGAMGPTLYVSEPRLTVTTFYSEDESVDLSSLVAGELKHPLLYY
jgi:transcriptional regulator with XRE-family HTH domain